MSWLLCPWRGTVGPRASRGLTVPTPRADRGQPHEQRRDRMDSHPEGSPGRDKKTPAASKSEKLTLAAGVVTLSTAVIKLVVTILDYLGP